MKAAFACQGATVDELRDNLRDVVTMLLEDGDPRFEAEFVGTRSIAVWRLRIELRATV